MTMVNAGYDNDGGADICQNNNNSYGYDYAYNSRDGGGDCDTNGDEYNARNDYNACDDYNAGNDDAVYNNYQDGRAENSANGDDDLFPWEDNLGKTMLVLRGE
jgi:hypothetical protein